MAKRILKLTKTHKDGKKTFKADKITQRRLKDIQSCQRHVKDSYKKSQKMVKMTSLDKNKHKFNRKFINKNEDPGQIGNLFCRLLTNG